MRIKLYYFNPDGTEKADWIDDSDELKTLHRTPLSKVGEEYTDYIRENSADIPNGWLQKQINSGDWGCIYLTVQNKNKKIVKLNKKGTSTILANREFEKSKNEITGKLKLMMKLQRLEDPKINCSWDNADLLKEWGQKLSEEWATLIGKVVEKNTNYRVFDTINHKIDKYELHTKKIILVPKDFKCKGFNLGETLFGIIIKFKHNSATFKNGWRHIDGYEIDFSKPSISLDDNSAQSRQLSNIKLSQLIHYINTFNGWQEIDGQEDRNKWFENMGTISFRFNANATTSVKRDMRDEIQRAFEKMIYDSDIVVNCQYGQITYNDKKIAEYGTTVYEKATINDELLTTEKKCRKHLTASLYFDCLGSGNFRLEMAEENLEKLIPVLKSVQETAKIYMDTKEN